MLTSQSSATRCTAFTASANMESSLAIREEPFLQDRLEDLLGHLDAAGVAGIQKIGEDHEGGRRPLGLLFANFPKGLDQFDGTLWIRSQTIFGNKRPDLPGVAVHDLPDGLQVVGEVIGRRLTPPARVQPIPD